jgi:acyl-coenzyme A synthetase/AMP-(fatty) acid ligase
LIYIFNHAEDTLVFIDPFCISLIEDIFNELKTIKKYIILGQEKIKTKMKSYFYEDEIKYQSENIVFPELNENDAFGLCYTSGNIKKNL